MTYLHKIVRKSYKRFLVVALTIWSSEESTSFSASVAPTAWKAAMLANPRTNNNVNLFISAAFLLAKYVTNFKAQPSTRELSMMDTIPSYLKATQSDAEEQDMRTAVYNIPRVAQQMGSLFFDVLTRHVVTFWQSNTKEFNPEDICSTNEQQYEIWN